MSDAAEIRELFMSGGICQHCGGIHKRACPRVRELEWHPNGTLKRVVYWPDIQWPDEFVIWPEDAYEEDDDE